MKVLLKLKVFVVHSSTVQVITLELVSSPVSRTDILGFCWYSVVVLRVAMAVLGKRVIVMSKLCLFLSAALSLLSSPFSVVLHGNNFERTRIFVPDAFQNTETRVRMCACAFNSVFRATRECFSGRVRGLRTMNLICHQKNTVCLKCAVCGAYQEHVVEIFKDEMEFFF